MSHGIVFAAYNPGTYLPQFLGPHLTHASPYNYVFVDVLTKSSKHDNLPLVRLFYTLPFPASTFESKMAHSLKTSQCYPR